MARASARPMPGMRPARMAAALSAVSTSPRSSLPTSAKGRSTGKGLPFRRQLQPLDRQSGEPDGNHTRHHETPRSNFAPAPRPGSARA